jgi:hypothetical protein
MLFREYGIESILDIPCGDFNWMNRVSRDGISYAGGDIVATLVDANDKAYAGPGVQFLKLDITCDRLPEADLVICRDGLVHMSYEDISRTLANVCTSNSRYLLTTSFVSLEKNSDIVTGEWRPINLERPPFRFPQPLAVINDYGAEGGGLRADKSMALWEVAVIPRNFEL